MKRQQFLRHRLQTLSALQDAVGAMRSLAAHHFRLARQALPAARQYRQEMDTILAEIGIQAAQPRSSVAGLLVVASDLGLCGDYNSRLAQLALAEVEKLEQPVVYTVGRRVRVALKKQALVITSEYDAPPSQEGLTRLLLQLSQDLLQDFLTGKISCLQVVSAGFEGVGHFATLSTRVLPVAPQSPVPALRPSPDVNRQLLTTIAVREFLYITLYEILLDALAAEHGMRLMAAESALDWLDSSTASTSRELVAARSEAATQELLDIVAGGRKRIRND